MNRAALVTLPLRTAASGNALLGLFAFRTKKETDCCTLDITSSNHASLASLAVTDRSQKDDPGSVQPRSWQDFRTRTRIALTSRIRQFRFLFRSKAA